MRFDNYELCIPEGRELSNGQVALNHGQHYTIRMSNHSVNRCDAQLEIDGKVINTFRLDGWQTWTLERPPHDNGRYTFYLANSEEGKRLGLVAGDSNLGLIKVTFTPELIVDVPRPVEPVTPRSYYPYIPTMRFSCAGPEHTGGAAFAANFCSASPGGTGLAGHSSQQFGYACTMALDNLNAVVIMLRLVCDKEPDKEPRVLAGRSTPVPAMAGI